MGAERRAESVVVVLKWPRHGVWLGLTEGKLCVPSSQCLTAYNRAGAEGVKPNSLPFHFPPVGSIE